MKIEEAASVLALAEPGDGMVRLTEESIHSSRRTNSGYCAHTHNLAHREAIARPAPVVFLKVFMNGRLDSNTGTGSLRITLPILARQWAKPLILPRASHSVYPCPCCPTSRCGMACFVQDTWTPESTTTRLF